MTPQQVELVQQSFGKLAAMGEPAWDGFYIELFAIEPSLKRMFKGDMLEQRKKLLAALARVILALSAPATILDPLKALAVRHVGYGVRPEHYTYMGNALLRTLEKGLGEEFTPELRNAWMAAFQSLATIMKEAAYGTAKSKMHHLPPPEVECARSEMWIIPL
jgi:hemoglobin-like flavoprotein